VGRQFNVVTAFFLLGLLTAGAAFGQGQPTPHLRPHGFGFSRGPGNSNGHGPFGNGRDQFNQLSPEERQAFRRNAERWLQMNPEQRKVLREREFARQQQLKAEAEAAMRQLGLRLDPNAQGQFEARYFQERRRIERELRQEVEAKRQQQLPQLNEKLKSEFQQPPGTATTASPSVEPSGRPRN
jgi:hypothetical protein